MEAIVTKAIFFLLLISIGNLLKVIGILKKEDHKILIKIVFNLTLPATLISGFKEFNYDNSLLILILLGIVMNVIMVFIGFFIGRGKSKEIRGMYMLCCSGYNISLFTIPLVASFLDRKSLIVVAMFDIGNLIMGLGGVCFLAAALTKADSGMCKRAILKDLFTNVPFLSYIVMLMLSITDIKLADKIFEFTDFMADANTVLVMLLIGLMFDIQVLKKIREVFQVLLVRYLFAGAILILIVNLSPLPREYNVALSIVAFAPVTTISPILCERMKYRYDTAGALFSCGIPISLFFITGLVLYLNL